MKALRHYKTHMAAAVSCTFGLISLAFLLNGFSKENSGIAGGINPAGATVALAGMAVLGIWVLRKASIKVPGLPWSQLQGIRIQGICPLGQGKNLMVVEVGRERFLIWSGKDRVGLLSRLTREQPEADPKEVAGQ